MKKYRIVEAYSDVGDKYYRLDVRKFYLFWVFDQLHHDLVAVNRRITELEKLKSKPKDKVIEYL